VTSGFTQESSSKKRKLQLAGFRLDVERTSVHEEMTKIPLLKEWYREASVENVLDLPALPSPDAFHSVSSSLRTLRTTEHKLRQANLLFAEPAAACETYRH
jgi:hypothetical protein